MPKHLRCNLLLGLLALLVMGCGGSVEKKLFQTDDEIPLPPGAVGNQVEFTVPGDGQDVFAFYQITLEALGWQADCYVFGGREVEGLRICPEKGPTNMSSHQEGVIYQLDLGPGQPKQRLQISLFAPYGIKSVFRIYLYEPFS